MTQNPNLMNGAALAYIGDAVYDLHIRHYMLSQGHGSPNKLHKTAIRFVSADAQAKIIKTWLTSGDFLSQDEIEMYKRGRNHKTHTKAKNASIGAYRQATGFESLMGWLFLTKQEERIQELVQSAIQIIEREA